MCGGGGMLFVSKDNLLGFYFTKSVYVQYWIKKSVCIFSRTEMDSMAQKDRYI